MGDSNHVGFMGTQLEGWLNHGPPLAEPRVGEKPRPMVVGRTEGDHLSRVLQELGELQVDVIVLSNSDVFTKAETDLRRILATFGSISLGVWGYVVCAVVGISTLRQGEPGEPLGTLGHNGWRQQIGGGHGRPDGTRNRRDRGPSRSSARRRRGRRSGRRGGRRTRSAGARCRGPSGSRRKVRINALVRRLTPGHGRMVYRCGSCQPYLQRD